MAKRALPISIFLGGLVLASSLTTPASAATSDAIVGQPTNTFTCTSSGAEQFAAGTVKLELQVTYPGAAPSTVGLKYSPFPKDPVLCPDSRFPYAFAIAWTPPQIGVAKLEFCTTFRGARRCDDAGYSLNVISATPTPTATPTPSATTPGSPRAIHTVAGNGSVKVSWSAPSSTGGQPVTKYVVKAVPGGKSCTTTNLACTVHGLGHGKQYTFSVTASNAVGQGTPAIAAPAKAK